MRVGIGLVIARSSEVPAAPAAVRYTVQTIDGSGARLITDKEPDRPPSYASSGVEIIPAPLNTPAIVYTVNSERRFVALLETINTDTCS